MDGTSQLASATEGFQGGRLRAYHFASVGLLVRAVASGLGAVVGMQDDKTSSQVE